MDIEIKCSVCDDTLQLLPEKYQNDGVDRWSILPHICEVDKSSAYYIVVYEMESYEEVSILATVKFDSEPKDSVIRKFVDKRFGKHCMWESVDYIEVGENVA